jgi:hypothetical protein
MANLHITRPKDESFEAYVAWIKNLCKNLGVEYTTSDDKARENHKKFWAAAKKESKK